MGWRKWDLERGWGAESERKRENRHWRAPGGEREKGWGWARKTVAGIERENEGGGGPGTERGAER